MEKELIARDIAFKAQQNLKGNFCMNLCKSLNSRRLEALDKYKQAGNLFKSIQKWEEAGECFMKCGEINESLNSISTIDYEESAHCYGQVNKNKQFEIYQLLLKLYEKNANFTGAGKVMNLVAEDYEKTFEYEKAIESYLKSADYYSMEGVNIAKQRQNDSLIKAADLMCIKQYKDFYSKSSQIYEKVALDYYNSPLLQCNARVIFFKIVCIKLAFSEVTNGENQLQKFLELDTKFSDTLEYSFLTESIKAIRSDSLHNFKSSVTNYHTSLPLDQWKITILTIIQNKLTGGKSNLDQKINEIDWK